MTRSWLSVSIILASFWVTAPGPAVACGFGEAPGDCGDTPESLARDMLKRVLNAVHADKTKALAQFTKGEGGFRTADTYVFCVGPDGVMSAHPNPALKGTDVRDLHDSTGNRFIAAMTAKAQAGKVSSIRYLFPRPGGTQEFPKTTYYTRADDQVCGVGVYDDSADASAVPQLPRDRLSQLRARLSAEMPTSLGSDWAAYQQALDEVSAAETAAFAKVRDNVRAAEALFATPPPRP